MSLVRVLAAFFAAVLTMMVLGVAAQSIFVLLELSAVGARIGLGDGLGMIFDDIGGLGPNYAIFIVLGFAIALPCAALVGRFVPVPRWMVFSAAGAVCMMVMLTLMKEVFFGVQLIAGARSMAGFIVQALMGALAAGVFACLTPSPKGRK